MLKIFCLVHYNSLAYSYSYSTILQIAHPSVAVSPTNNFRIIWCPYVPSLEEDSNTYDDPALTFALINRNKGLHCFNNIFRVKEFFFFLVEIWDVSIVQKEYGSGPLYPRRLEGYMEIDAHSDDIVHASFSPDGTALATVGLDGFIRFFQVNILICIVL